MSVWNILYLITIYPLELLFEIVFYLANSLIANPGLSIIVLSLVVNFAVLPLYMRADLLQKEEREKEAQLNYWVKHIRKTFKGDERFMMLQAYYRENDYKPVYVFKSVLPLALQIPFFIAALRFLSNLSILKGFSFGPVSDLGAPDGLLVLGGVAINVLPILMTLINVVSGTIYTKGFPIKEKIQLYGIALIFLFLLYDSPSGLVFYWLLNNLFSLTKNVFYRLKNPRHVLKWLSLLTGIIIMISVLPRHCYSVRQKAFVTVLGLLLMLPKLVDHLPGKYTVVNKGCSEEGRTIGCIYALSALFISLTIGALIPSAVLSSSTADFVDVYALNDPTQYVLYSMCISFGLFVVWMGIYYLLLNPETRAVFSCVVCSVSFVFIIDYMFFGTNLGVMSRNLIFDAAPNYSVGEIIINIGIILVVVAVCFIVGKRYPKLVITVLCSGILITGIFIVNSMMRISSDYKEIEEIAKISDDKPVISLSSKEKNVVILMIDRLFGYYIPFIMNEDPSLYDSFAGFTYYPNTISFGMITYLGSPGLFGGYEYTPARMNERDDELLADKHNEALKLMPALFTANGYDVSIFDPPCANYKEPSDLSIYNDYPGVKKYFSHGKVKGKLSVHETLDDYGRRFFMYSLFKVSPVIMQPGVYNRGNYNAIGGQYNGQASEGTDSAGQVMDGLYKAKGMNKDFLDAYNVLDGLEKMTEINDSDRGTYMAMDNLTSHEMTLLQLPDYVPEEYVDNTAYADSYTEKYDADGRKIELLDERFVQHYHIDMAAMKKVAEWLDYLKEQGVYDNTRIIIVSDHAYPLYHDGVLLVDDDKGEKYNCFGFNCALMVKDFNDRDFKVNNDFMTNADVPTIALDGIIDDPINPFTGNPVDNSEKNSEELQLSYIFKLEDGENKGYKFPKCGWFTVHDDIFKNENWKYLGEY